MKVLITGGAGFIGSHTAERLLSRGDTVLVLDNYATGKRSHLPAEHPRLTVVEGTIADWTLMDRVFAEFRPNVVIHTAASYNDPEAWSRDVETNVLGGVNVCRAAKVHGVGRIIYFQTALCYGLKPVEQPITLAHHIDSRGSSYAISKTAAEQYIQLCGIDWVSFRLANIIGPRSYSGPLATFFKRLSEGKGCFVTDTRRDFVFVEDLVNYVIKAVDGVGHGAYHLSSGKDAAIEDLYDAVVVAMKLSDPPPLDRRARSPDDAYSILLDPSRAEQDFGIRAETPLAAAVGRAVEQYGRDGIGATHTHLKHD